MAAQTHGLLVHGGLVRVDGRLGDDAGLVDGRIRQHLLHAGEQLLAVLAHALRRADLHLTDHALDLGRTVSHILSQFSTLAGTHFVEIVAGFAKDGQHIAGHLVRVLLDALGAEHVRQLRQTHHAHVIAQTVPVGQLMQRRQIVLRDRMVHRNRNVAALLRLHADVNLNLAACNARRGGLFHGIIQKAVLTRSLYRAVQIAVVDRTHLCCDGSAVQLLLGTSIAGHTLHRYLFPFLFGRQGAAQQRDHL